MTCPHATDVCLISTKLAGKPVPIADDACRACSACETPQAVNRVTISKAISVVGPEAELVDSLARLTHPERFTGVGSELRKLIWWFVWNRKSDAAACEACVNRELQMNRWGKDCRENMPTILAWLKESAITYNLPFIEVVARGFVELAIFKAGV